MSTRAAASGSEPVQKGGITGGNSNVSENTSTPISTRRAGQQLFGSVIPSRMREKGPDKNLEI